MRKVMVLCLVMLNVIQHLDVNAQTGSDTIKLITYNVGNFGTVATSQCPLFNLNLKSAYLRTVIKYEKPDIIGMVKINGSQQFCTDTIVRYVLDSLCNGCWGYGTYTNVSTYQKENMLYFNTSKFGFAGSNVIYSADPNISDITLHKLFYKSPNLSSTHDTVFLKIVLAHLQSGSGNTSGRGTEVAGAMTWLNAHISVSDNLIFMGDLNTTASTEACFQDLISSSNSNTRFFDPPNQLGNWAGNPAAFAMYLTQSTRTNDPGDCNATGGINNRFDHILFTSTIKNGADSVKYIAGSYKVVGQDGNHTNTSLIHSPANTAVPVNVDSALYFMSEHLPVSLKMKISYPVALGIDNYDHGKSISIYPNPATTSFTITSTGSKIKEIKVFTVLGELVNREQAIGNNQSTINVSQYSKGIYFENTFSI